MRNKFLNLLVALLTLGFGILAGSVWTNYNLVDKRFAKSLQKVYLKNAEETHRRISISAQKPKIDIKQVEKFIKEHPPKDPETQARILAELKKFEEENKQISLPVELPKADLEDTIDGRVAQDVKSTDENCRVHSFSKQQCDQMKEDAIKDIEENILNQ